MTSHDPDIGDLTSHDPDVGDLTSHDPDVGDLTSHDPDVGDLTSHDPDVGDLTSHDPDVGDLTSDPAVISSVSEDQGTFEMEVLCPGAPEVDLYKGFRRCAKDPTHDGFIPVPEFSNQHLPEPFRDDPDVLRFIQLQAFLTVRLRVFYISTQRPKHFPGSTKPYPFANSAGKKVTRVGTGKVDQAYVPIREGGGGGGGGGESEDKTEEETSGSGENLIDYEGPCPCDVCKNSSSPAREWGIVTVLTSTHVLFDQSEVAHSQVELFYDDDVTREERVVTLSGHSVGQVNQYKDWCILHCPTHDLDLIKRLNIAVLEYPSMMSHLTRQHARTAASLAVITSHPHGCSKKVSLGAWTGMEEQGYGKTLYRVRFTYTTPTCRGSSGAPVCLFGGWPAEAQDDWWKLYPLANHSDGFRKYLNKSGDASEVPFM